MHTPAPTLSPPPSNPKQQPPARRRAPENGPKTLYLKDPLSVAVMEIRAIVDPTERRRAENAFIQKSAKFIGSRCVYVAGPDQDPDEVFAVARCAFWQAMTRWLPEGGRPFYAFAIHGIKWALKQHLARSRMVRGATIRVELGDGSDGDDVAMSPDVLTSLMSRADDAAYGERADRFAVAFSSLSAEERYCLAQAYGVKLPVDDASPTTSPAAAEWSAVRRRAVTKLAVAKLAEMCGGDVVAPTPHPKIIDGGRYDSGAYVSRHTPGHPKSAPTPRRRVAPQKAPARAKKVPCGVVTVSGTSGNQGPLLDASRGLAAMVAAVQTGAPSCGGCGCVATTS